MVPGCSEDGWGVRGGIDGRGSVRLKVGCEWGEARF